MKRLLPVLVLFTLSFPAAPPVTAQPLAPVLPAQGDKAALKELSTPSPDGKSAAFVRQANLFVLDPKTKEERQLTKDGGNGILNGKASWVYWEELYHRSNYRAFYWSPDSRTIAFLRFDERKVPRVPIHHHSEGKDQFIENMSYPRAGEPNPTVKLGIADIASGNISWVDLKGYSPDVLISRVGWLPDGMTAFFYVQDRAQTWLDVCTVPAAGGEPTKLLRDQTKAWVEDPGPLLFLKDGSFLMLSERTGYNHLYHFDKTGKLIRPLTSGEWEIRSSGKGDYAKPVSYLDEANGWVYFLATKDGHLGQNLYRVKLDGTELTRLTPGAGYHSVSIDAKAGQFTDTWSNHKTPPRSRTCKLDGTMISETPVQKKAPLVNAELVQIPTPDGFTLDAVVIKPPDFDPDKKYPVWYKTYGGPHTPEIRDVWGLGVRDRNTVAQGYVVFYCDPRSASGRGAAFTGTAYRQLGVQEMKDIDTAIKWITKHPWADPERVGMSGFSYGGFLTAYAMTHSKLFAAGVAGGPVTDWRYYDSIYTERYMNTPQANPKGYDETSVVKAAKNLHGRLLLVHGLIDDNVHARNTIQLADALQLANRDFEMMLYPRDRHGIGYGAAHFQRLTNEFMRRNLKPGM
jgi:dipeptidyl-peptidase-4